MAMPRQMPWMTKWQPPLINRLVDASMRQAPDFNKSLEETLASLRRYSAVSVAREALTALDVQHLRKLDQLGAAPWHSMLLLKWKLLQTSGPVQDGQDMPTAEFDRLRERLWHTNSALRPDSPGFNLTAMLRSLMAVQMEFQRPTTAEFMRWPALIAALPNSHTVRRQFDEAVGIDPEAFMDLGMATHTKVMDGKILDKIWFSNLRPTYGDRIDRYLSLVSRSLTALRDELQADVSQQERRRSELRELPYIRRYPLLQIRADQYWPWHPDVFARGLEDAIHLRLSVFGQAYADPFGRVFEDYVVGLLEDAGLEYMSEDEIRAAAEPRSKVVEAIVSSSGCNVLVEAKTVLEFDQLLVRDDAAVLYDRTRNIRNAIEQGWSVSEQVRHRAEAFGRYAAAEQDFLLVVTSRELYLGGGLILQRLYPPGRFEHPPGPGERLRKTMPLENIFIASVGDFEALLGYVKASGRPIGDVLRQAAASNREPETSKYLLRMHFESLGNRKGPRLFRETLNACGERLVRALGHQGEWADLFDDVD